MSDAFISYSRFDGEGPLRIRDDLQSSGLSVWIDVEGIPPTAEWRKEIFAAIEGANTFLVLLSPAWLDSEICRVELQHAVTHGKRIVPLLYHSIDGRETPEALASRQWLKINGEDPPSSSVDKIVRAITANPDWLRAHTRLVVRAVEWNDRKQDQSFCLRGTELQDAESWLRRAKDLEPNATDLQRSFVQASRRLADRRRRRLTAAVVAVAGVVATGSGVAWWLNRVANERLQIAQSQDLAAGANRLIERRLDQALLVATEAWQTAQTAEARTTLLSALQQSPHLLRYLRPITEELGSATFSPDRKLVAVTAKQSVRIESTEQSNVVRASFKTPDDTGKMFFTADGKRLITCYYNAGFGVWDVATGTNIKNVSGSNKDRRDCDALSNDGRLLLVGLNDALQLWDTDAMQPTGSLMPKPTSPVHSTGFRDDGTRVEGWSDEPVQTRAAAFSPDGNLVAIGYADDSVILWNVSSGKQVGKPLVGHERAVTAVAFSPDSRTLASGSDDHKIRFWNVQTGEAIGQALEHHEESLTSLAFAPNAKLLASGDLRGSIALWSLKDGPRYAYAKASLTGHTSEVSTLAWESNGSLLSFASNMSIIRWNVSSGAWPLLPGYADALAVSADGALIASGGANDVTIWRVAERTAMATLKVTTAGVNALAFTPDGRRIAVGGAGGSLEVWDVFSGDRTAVNRHAHRADIHSLAFDPSGRILVSCGIDPGVWLWHAEDLTLSQTLRDEGNDYVGHLAFTPDGRLLAAGGRGGAVTLWEMNGSPRIAGHVTASGDSTKVAFSPDGKLLATGTDGGVVEVWSTVKLGRERAPLDPRGMVTSIAFSPDGSTLTAGLGDGAIRLWDARSFAALEPSVKLLDSILAGVWFVPRSHLIAAAGFDGVALFDTRPDSWTAQACRIVQRNLTPVEWGTLLPNTPFRGTCPGQSH
jgi:WD40 repeat protein